MTGFSSIKKLIIPLQKLEKIYEHLRTAGSHGMEGIGLLLGVLEDDTFTVTTALVPRQSAYRTENGLLYHVEGEELHRINVWAYQNKLLLIAQIHSHPQEAFHSETDDSFAIVSSIGGFSIVVPNFAAGPIDIRLWEVYRLEAAKGWTHISKQALIDLFQIATWE